MAKLNFTGFESGDDLSATNADAVAAFGGSIQTSVKRTGSYAFRANTTTTQIAYREYNTYSATGAFANFNVANLFGSGYVRYATKAAANNEEILEAVDSGGIVWNVRLGSDGKLTLYEGTTLRGTGSAVLSADTWYLIEFNFNNTANTQEVKVNGTVDISASAAIANNFVTATLGKKVNRNSQTQDVFFDDWCWDDAGYPGSGECKIAVPIGAGAASGWTNGTGTTFAEVDEIPPSPADYIQASSTQDNLDHTFDMQAAATIGIAGAIGAVKTVVIAQTASTSGTSTVAHRRLFNGSGFELTALELSPALTDITLAKIDETDPSAGGGAITTGDFDSIEVGMAANAIAQTQRFSSAYLFVWSAGGGATPVSVAGNQPASTGTIVALRVKSLAGSQPATSGALTAKQTLLKSLAGNQPAASGTARPKLFKTLAGAQAAPSGTIAAVRLSFVALAGAQPSASGALTARITRVATLTGNQAAPSGALTARQTLLKTLTGAQAAPSGTIAKKYLITPRGNQPAATGAITARQTLARTLAGAQAAPSGALSIAYRITIAGNQPSASGAVTAEQDLARLLAGSQPPASGALTARQLLLRAVAGEQPAPSGALTIQYKITLAGNQAAPSGTIAAVSILLVALAGNQPSASGDLEIVYKITLTGSQGAPSGALAQTYLITLRGNQPSATGALAALQDLLRLLSGDQPPASGTIAAQAGTAVDLDGDQPAGSGTLAILQLLARTLAGSQPSASGTIAAEQDLARLLSGNQPASTGVLSALQTLFRTLAGAQPAASGDVTADTGAVEIDLSGNQPAATGNVFALQALDRDLAGSQPAPSGSIRALQTLARTLTGNQPSATGSVTVPPPIPPTPPPSPNVPGGGTIITRGRAGRGPMPLPPLPWEDNRPFSFPLAPREYAVTTAGRQPAPSGALYVEQHLARAVTGSQPAATGAVWFRWVVPVRELQPNLVFKSLPEEPAPVVYRIMPEEAWLLGLPVVMD